MDLLNTLILPRLVSLGAVFFAILWFWALYHLIQMRRKNKVTFRLPITSGATFLLLVTASIIMVASLLGAGGFLLGRLFTNPGQQFTFVGALVGAVVGGIVGWELQRRSTL